LKKLPAFVSSPSACILTFSLHLAAVNRIPTAVLGCQCCSCSLLFLLLLLLLLLVLLRRLLLQSSDGDDIKLLLDCNGKEAWQGHQPARKHPCAASAAELPPSTLLNAK